MPRSDALAACVRMKHVRMPCVEVPTGKTVRCDVCGRQSRGVDFPRTTCERCDIDVCDKCADKLDAVVAAVPLPQPWRNPLFSEGQATPADYAALGRIARAIVEARRDLFGDPARWHGRFSQCLFTVTDAECGQFTIWDVIHCLSQQSVGGMTFTYFSAHRDGPIVCAALPLGGGSIVSAAFPLGDSVAADK